MNTVRVSGGAGDVPGCAPSSTTTAAAAGAGQIWARARRTSSACSYPLYTSALANERQSASTVNIRDLLLLQRSDRSKLSFLLDELIMTRMFLHYQLASISVFCSNSTTINFTICVSRKKRWRRRCVNQVQ